MKRKKILIVGGGMAGCASANILSELDNTEIFLVEKSNTLGAGVRTFFYANEHPYTFGPRHFLTRNKDVYEYFNKIIPMQSCSNHIFISYVESDDQFFHYPINMDDIKKMKDREQIKKELNKKDYQKIEKSKNLEDYWINSVGQKLYDKIIKNYNHKMWMVRDNRLIDTFNWSPKGATIKKGNAAAWEKVYSCYPIKKNGYNDYFDRLTKISNVRVLLNKQIKVSDLKKKIFFLNNEEINFDIVINTISPDFYFNEEWGSLKFIGRDMYFLMFPTENVFPENTSFVYFPNKEKFTRMVEYKKFTKHKSPHSLIGLEIPSLNGKHYPLPFKDEIRKSLNYINEMPAWFFSIGRAGTYRYAVDIDDCIEQALEIKKIIQNGNFIHPFPLKKWLDFDLYETNK